MKRQYKKVKLEDFKLDKDNPRKIKKAQKEKLKKSIENFPEMLKINSIVIDEQNNVLAGNQRVAVMQEMYEPTYEIEVLLVEGLTEEQKKEFKLKDNTHYGDFDIEKLFEEYEEEMIFDAGLDLKLPTDKKENEVVSDSECKMPIVPIFDEKHECIVIVSDNEIDTNYVVELLGLNRVASAKKKNFGRGFAIDVKDFIEKIERNKNGDEYEKI